MDLLHSWHSVEGIVLFLCKFSSVTAEACTSFTDFYIHRQRK